MRRYFLRDRKETRQNDSFRDTYARLYTLFSCVSFLKRTCSHAIPYKKTDAARNVPLETRYMYVCTCGTDSSCRTHTRIRTHARVSSGRERAHREGEAHDNSALAARSCLQKMENGKKCTGACRPAPMHSQKTLYDFLSSGGNERWGVIDSPSLPRRESTIFIRKARSTPSAVVH